jgi:hypothetical protein
MHYPGGVFTGNFQDLTDVSGELRIDQVDNINGGGYSNQPPNVYTYGGVLSWRTANHSFQLYASHTGDLTFKTQWQNDNYSGWRRILHESNYTSFVNYGNPSTRGTYQISNWNQTTYPNVHFLSSENSTTNAPTSDYTYGLQYAFHRDGASYRTQMVTALYSNLSIYVRNSRDSDTWTSWKELLHSGNYTSYAPSLTGSGASGTWSINVTGSAGSAPANGGTATALNGSNYISRTGSSGNYNTDFNNTPAGSVRHHGDDANTTNNPGGTWWFVDNYRHSNSSSYWGTQIAWGWEDNANKLAQRNVSGGNWGGWVYYLNSGNYNSYAPSLTGSGASGTWGINVTGTAGSISGYNNPTTADTPNTIAYRNGSGDIAVREITLNSNLSTQTPTVLASIFPTTNQLVRTTPAAVSEAIRTAASGTWGINVTGNAATITSQANSATINASTGVNGNDIVRRDGNGYIYANHINFSTSESENATINSFITSNGDGWSRKASLAHAKNSIRGVADGTWGISISGTAANASAVSGVGVATLRGLVGYNSVGFYVYGDANTYYPVVISLGGQFGMNRYSITRGYADPAPWDPIGTGSHKGGLTLTFDCSSDIAWGGNDKSWRIIQFSEQYTNMVAGMALPVTEGIIVWLRGGGSGGAYYSLQGPNGINHSATPYYGTYTAANGATYAVRTNLANVDSEIRAKWPIRGYGDGDMYVGNNIVLNAGNYSSYALPLSGGTVSGGVTFNGSNTFTAVTYFTSNRNTDSSNPPLQAFSSNGSGAIMSFHRSGYFAVNFGLDSDNVMRIGGWSASANRWQLDMSGNMTVPGNSYANDVYTTGGWFRNHTNNNGIYWSVTGWHLYPSSSSDFYVRSGANGGTLRFLESGGTTYGYLHWASDRAMGFLTDGGSWRFRVDNNANLSYISTISMSGYLYINGGDPTIVLQDTNNRSSMIHCNSNIFYILRGSGTNSTGWTTYNGYWPMEINLENNDATFGGNITAIYNVTAYSDVRLKQDIETINNAMDKVQQIRGVTFTRTDDVEDVKKRHVGVIAQEIEQVLPEVVSEDKNGIKNVAYGNIVGLLIEAIKEQQKKIEELEQRINNS